jgi:hypothetical protein
LSSSASIPSSADFGGRLFIQLARRASREAVCATVASHIPPTPVTRPCIDPPIGPIASSLASKRKRTGGNHTDPFLKFRTQQYDSKLAIAAIHGVNTGRLNEAVKRNADRLPEDFMFRLSAAEQAALISQIATSKPGRGGRRKLPWAFTEHGAIQAANVLNSPRAIAMGVYVVRAFVRLRELLASNTALTRKLDELERKYKHHDEAIAAILSAIRELMHPPAPKRRGIGFTADVE